jgi:seryl-tRNA synthetase
VSVGYQRLREEPDLLRRAAADKVEDPALVVAAIELDAERRAQLAQTDALRAERKDISAEVGAAM